MSKTADQRRIDNLRNVCADVYQVVGALSHYANVFCTKDIERALDNLAAAADGRRIPHKDLLPWPKDPRPFVRLERRSHRAKKSVGRRKGAITK
jgi:dihydroorotase